MVGNFYKYRGKTFRVIREDDAWVDAVGKEGDEVYTIPKDKLKGIPLKDCLKKLHYNNFSLHLADDIECTYNPHINVVNIVAKNDVIIGCNQILMRVDYLHQLQDAVRLLGKEIQIDI